MLNLKIIKKEITTKNKKSQVFGIDLIAATLIFIFATFLFFNHVILMNLEASKIEDLTSEAERVIDIILLEGYPKEWTIEDVSRIGITTEKTNEISNTKLANFAGLARDDYTLTKSLISTKYDYHLCLLNKKGKPISHKNIGKPGSDCGNLASQANNFKHLTKINRFVIFENQTRLMEFYLWEEE